MAIGCLPLTTSMDTDQVQALFHVMHVISKMDEHTDLEGEDLQ